MPDHSWICDACHVRNPSYTEVCRECGNPYTTVEVNPEPTATNLPTPAPPMPVSEGTPLAAKTYNDERRMKSAKMPISLYCSGIGWAALMANYIANLPSVKPANGTFVLLMIPYVFAKGMIGLLGIFSPIVAILIAIRELIKDPEIATPSWLAIAASFVSWYLFMGQN